MDLGSVIAFLSLSVASVAGFLATVTRMWATNEREKAELTVTMLLDWTNKLDHTTDRCILLSECLSTGEIEKIWEEEPVSIDESKKKALGNIFGEANLKVENGKINLSEYQTSLIEFHWKTYLNRLEFMLTAWREELINEPIMLNQLGKFLGFKKTDLEMLLTVKTKKYFPITADFLEEKIYESGLKKKKGIWLRQLLSR